MSCSLWSGEGPVSSSACTILLPNADRFVVSQILLSSAFLSPTLLQTDLLSRHPTPSL